MFGAIIKCKQHVSVFGVHASCWSVV